jgi:hypothetical protein
MADIRVSVQHPYFHSDTFVKLRSHQNSLNQCCKYGNFTGKAQKQLIAFSQTEYYLHFAF